jgi:glutamyl-tRNA reductase
MPGSDSFLNQPNVWVIGVNHDAAPIAVRERLALSGEALTAAHDVARHVAHEAVILSTCNRLEIYALLSPGERPETVFHGVFGEAGEVRPFIYSRRGSAAVAHLLRVAAGIDSLVIGEVQILGQVQRAWQTAHRAGAAGPVLSQLFHRAVTLGKRVHSETSISKRPASISYAAVVLARQTLGPELAERRVLVIGTGEVGEGVARCLYEQGVHATVVAHRELERAHNVARRYQAAVAHWEELAQQLLSADIVISSTSAPHLILQRQHIEDAMRGREERPLYLIDLALPRDIDPASADVPGVYLHNIDDLHAVVRSSMVERRSALPRVNSMVAAEARSFGKWLKARSALPAISDLREKAHDVTQDELKRALSKLPSLSPRERKVVEMMATRIAGKLLHGPIQMLKAQAADRQPDAAEPDYGLDLLSQTQLEELFYTSEGADGAEKEQDTVE